MKEWNNFVGSDWQNEINVADFIATNYTEYKGDDSFLVGPTTKTENVWSKCKELLKKELDKGVLDVEGSIVSGINNFNPGYINEEDNCIVGLQTDAP